MPNKRHKPGETVTKLRQGDVLVGQGMARMDAIRELRDEPLSGCQWWRHWPERPLATVRGQWAREQTY